MFCDLLGPLLQGRMEELHCSCAGGTSWAVDGRSVIASVCSVQAGAARKSSGQPIPLHGGHREVCSQRNPGRIDAPGLPQRVGTALRGWGADPSTSRSLRAPSGREEPFRKFLQPCAGALLWALCPMFCACDRTDPGPPGQFDSMQHAGTPLREAPLPGPSPMESSDSSPDRW